MLVTMASAGTTTVCVDSRKQQIKKTLQQAVSVMCRNSVMYSSTLSIEAVIGITIDDGADSLIISINEAFKRSEVESEWLQSERKPTVTFNAQPDTSQYADIAAAAGKAHSAVNRKPRRRSTPKVGNETSFRRGQCIPSEPHSAPDGAEHEYCGASYNDEDDCIEIQSEDEQFEMDVKFTAAGSIADDATMPAGNGSNFPAASLSRSAYDREQAQYFRDENSYGEVDAGVDIQYVDDKKYHVADFGESYAHSQTVSRAGATAKLRGKKSQYRSKQASFQQKYRRSLAVVGDYGRLARKQKQRSRFLDPNLSNQRNRARVCGGNATVDWQQTETGELCDQTFVGDVTGPSEVTYSTTYTCNICGTQMGRLDSFRRHKRSHLSRTAARCDICGRIFSRNDNMMAHRRRCAGALE